MSRTETMGSGDVRIQPAQAADATITAATDAHAVADDPRTDARTIDPRTIDPRTIDTDSRTIDTDSRTIDTGPRTIDTDSRTIDPRTIDTDSRTIDTDSRTIDPRTIDTDSRTIDTGPRTDGLRTDGPRTDDADPRTDNAASPPSTVIDWRTVDHALRTIASRRAALDAEEARWLREAEALQIWKPLGMVSALDYLERVLHYAPRTAQDRLRVARALGDLPQLNVAFASGQFGFSAVRELTRVVTPNTEAEWLRAAAGKTLRQIEDMVAYRKPGDGPDDPPDPEPRMHVIRFELSAETFALMRQTRCVLNDEHGTNLPDDALVAAMCSAVLDGSETSEPTGRAKFQIALTVCERCNQGWQEGGGAHIPVGADAVERAMCDAQHLGSTDRATPERAHQDIPPSIVRFVRRRDGGRCRVPGCRSARALEVHHIIHRADGGDHDPSGLVLLCGSCHRAHHRGQLAISGTSDALIVRRPNEPDHARGSTASPQPIPAANAHVDAQTPPPPTIRAANAHGHAQTPPSPTIGIADAHVGAQTPPPPTVGANAHVHTQTPPPPTIGIADAHVHTQTPPPPTVGANAHVGAQTLPPPTIPAANAHGHAQTPPSPTIGAANAHVHAQTLPPPTVPAANAHVGAQTLPPTIRGANAHVGGVAGPTARELRTSPPVRVPNKLDRAILQAQAKAALTSLGWKPAIALAAVAAASAAHGIDMTLEGLIRESLRRCPVPKA